MTVELKYLNQPVSTESMKKTEMLQKKYVYINSLYDLATLSM